MLPGMAGPVSPPGRLFVCMAGRVALRGVSMAANWWSQTVNPPRYFLGFLVVQRGRQAHRIDFIDAPILPLNPHCAAVFSAGRGDAYYSCHAVRRPLRVLEIQYAISVLNARRGTVQVEKFNHPFESPTLIGMLDGLTCIYTEGGGPLYDTFPLGDVLDDYRGERRKVLQFIA